LLVVAVPESASVLNARNPTEAARNQPSDLESADKKMPSMGLSGNAAREMRSGADVNNQNQNLILSVWRNVKTRSSTWVV